MSPRPYQLGKRQAQIDDSRRRIVDAARALLTEATSYTEFSVGTMAKRADVARATVYYQFATKSGVLEALCDSLAETGQLSSVAGVFMTPDPGKALQSFVAAFGRFWDADRLVMRRLRSLANLDPEVRAVIDSRDDRRRQGIKVLVDRVAEQPSSGSSIDREEAVRVIHCLTSFETFDSLAGSDRNLADVIPTVQGLVEAALAKAQVTH